MYTIIDQHIRVIICGPKGFLGKFNEKHADFGEIVRSSQHSIAEGESESSDDESEAEMKFIRKTVKSRGNVDHFSDLER